MHLDNDSASPPLPTEDLQRVCDQVGARWEGLSGQRIFLTGATGFVGSWLLESLLWASDQKDLRLEAVVLCRDPQRFRTHLPHLANHPAVRAVEGDVVDFEFPPGQFPYIVHAATPVTTESIERHPRELFDTIVLGTRRVLVLARDRGTRRMLHISSGAVYGVQPADLQTVDEDYRGGPDCLDPRSVYAEGKRAAELLCALAGRAGDLTAVIARCFAFVGPRLPLDAHFAAGNFIRDRLAKQPIRVKGDGTACRSYLYASDLAAWLWTILLNGTNGRAYNVGSDAVVSVADLARLVAQNFNPILPVTVELVPQPGAPVARYMPSVARARNELGLQSTVMLQEALDKSIHWYSKWSASKPSR